MFIVLDSECSLCVIKILGVPQMTLHQIKLRHFFVLVATGFCLLIVLIISILLLFSNRNHESLYPWIGSKCPYPPILEMERDDKNYGWFFDLAERVIHHSMAPVSSFLEGTSTQAVIGDLPLKISNLSRYLEFNVISDCFTVDQNYYLSLIVEYRGYDFNIWCEIEPQESANLLVCSARPRR